MEVTILGLMLERMNEAIDSLANFQREVLNELPEDESAECSESE